MYEIHEVATTILFDHDLFEKGDSFVRDWWKDEIIPHKPECCRWICWSKHGQNRLADMPFNLTCLMIRVLRCFKHVLKMCYNVLHSQMFLFLWQLEFRTPLTRIFLALGVCQVRLNRKDLEPEYLKTLFPQEPWRRLCYLDTPSVKKVGRSGTGFRKRIWYYIW